jgi:hypothetical protein
MDNTTMQKLIGWKIGTYTIGQKIPEEIIKTIVELIEKKEEITQKITSTTQLPGTDIISSEMKAREIRKHLFDLRKINQQIRQIFKNKHGIDPKYCIHPEALQEKKEDMTNRCLICGHI